MLRNNFTDIVYEDIPGNGWRMRMQVGLVVRRPGFEAIIAKKIAVCNIVRSVCNN